MINLFLEKEATNVNNGATPQDQKPIEVYKDDDVDGVSITVVDTRGLRDPRVGGKSISILSSFWQIQFIRTILSYFDLYQTR